MSVQIVKADTPVAIRRKPGSTVTFNNYSAVDVYVSNDRSQLAASLPGVAPSGTKLAATTGSLQVVNFPGVVWARSATDTTIEIV